MEYHVALRNLPAAARTIVSPLELLAVFFSPPSM